MIIFIFLNEGQQLSIEKRIKDKYEWNKTDKSSPMNVPFRFKVLLKVFVKVFFTWFRGFICFT